VFGLIRDGAFAQTTDEVQAIGGRAPLTIADFARAHAAAFGG
jgi:hypothetical protein